MQLISARINRILLTKTNVSTALQQHKHIFNSRCFAYLKITRGIGLSQKHIYNPHWMRSPERATGVFCMKSLVKGKTTSVSQEKDQFAPPSSSSFPDTTSFGGEANGIPKSALYIGFGGAVPFIALSIASGIQIPFPLAIAKAQASYAACILTFLGAVHWGKALESEKPEWKVLACSVAPCLYGWITFAFPSQVSLYMLAVGLTGAYMFDIRQTHFPRWYRTLRMPLTLIAVSCVLLTAYNTPLF